MSVKALLSGCPAHPSRRVSQAVGQSERLTQNEFRYISRLFVIPAKEAVRKSRTQKNPSSPRKRGPRSKRLKSLGSRFRGNDEERMLAAGLCDWITASKAGIQGS